MALERFIPKSPDPFIRNSQDFEVAKFGHLNTIIEYVNSYVVTDSLQLAGSGPITSTARYISDSLGNNSAISISTIGVGIGTDAPTSLLDVVRYTTGSVNNNYQFRILNSADGLYPYSVLLLEHNNRTGVGNQGGASIAIRDGFANVNRGGLGFDYFNSTTYTSAGGSLRLSNDGQGNVYIATNGTDAIRVFKDQGVQIGGISTGGSTSVARLLVKGSGSTSATTSLLVQNSNANQLFSITDDGSTTISLGTHNINGTRLNISTNKVFVGSLSLTSSGAGDTGQAIWSTGGDGQIILAGSLGGFVIKSWASSTITLINTANPRNLFSIQQYGFSDGNTNGLTGNTMNIAPIYNFTGVQASATVRGIYYNPTLTSLVSTTHIALETVTGNVLLGTTSGFVGIGTSSPTSKLYLDGGLFTKKYYTDTSSQTINFGSAYELFGTPHASSGYSFFINPTGFSSGWDVNIGDATTYFNFNYSTGFSAFKVNATALILGESQLSFYKSSPDTGWSYNSAGGWNFVIRGSADEKLKITSGGNVLINTTTDLGGKLSIKGSGSTSATTSLLVQNSAGSQRLKVSDNGLVSITYIDNSPAGVWSNEPSFGTYGMLIGCVSNSGDTAIFTKGNTTGSSALRVTDQNIGASRNHFLVDFAGASGFNLPNGTTTVNASAQVEIQSTTKGFLPPRMTNVQRAAITTPAIGLMVYCTDSVEGLYVYKSTGWTFVA
jgi:hypothetical protein